MLSKAKFVLSSPIDFSGALRPETKRRNSLGFNSFVSVTIAEYSYTVVPTEITICDPLKIYFFQLNILNSSELGLSHMLLLDNSKG